MSGHDIVSGANCFMTLGRLRLSGFGPRPFGPRFGREARGTYTITKFSECLPQEPSQPKTLRRRLRLSQGSCDLEGIDRGGSHTGITVNSIPDRGQAGHDDFDLLRATLTNFNDAGASICTG